MSLIRCSTLAGQWDETLQSGVLTRNQSTNSDLLEYPIRMSFGPTFDNANNSVVGSETPGTSQHVTVVGLGNAGDGATFKVYVVLSTGNEAGSNPVTITKPSNGA